MKIQKIIILIILIIIFIFLLTLFKNNVKTKFGNILYDSASMSSDGTSPNGITTGEAATKNSPDIIFSYTNPSTYGDYNTAPYSIFRTAAYTAGNSGTSFKLPYCVLFDLGISGASTIGYSNEALTSANLNASSNWTGITVGNVLGYTFTTYADIPANTKALITRLAYQSIYNRNGINLGPTLSSSEIFVTSGSTTAYGVTAQAVRLTLEGLTFTVRSPLTIYNYYAFGIALVNNLYTGSIAPVYTAGSQTYGHVYGKFKFVKLFLDINNFIVQLGPGEVIGLDASFGTMTI